MMITKIKYKQNAISKQSRRKWYDHNIIQ